MRIIWSQFILLCCLFMSNAIGQNWDKLFEPATYQNAKISPDGKYLAVAVRANDKIALIFLDRKTMKNLGSANFAGHSEVGDFYWVNNERVVIKIVQREPWLEKPQFYGELYAVNYDGSYANMIYGYKAGDVQIGTRIHKKKAIRGWGDIIDVLPNDPRQILISSTPQSSTGERTADIYKLDVYTGVIKKKLGQAPIPFANFLTDGEGNIRAVVGTNHNNDRKIYLKNGNNGWKALPNGIVGDRVSPISVSNSGKFLYTIDYSNGNIWGIYKLNLADLSYHEMFTDKVADITDLSMSSDGHEFYAARIDENYPTYILLSQNIEASVFKNLLRTFPYSTVLITSKSRDKNFYVVRVASDINPGTFYLYDKKQNKLALLFKLKPKLKSSDFAEMQPIKFPATDGTTLYGYFTPAKNIPKGKLAPTVVLVHGGPHGERDYWRFSSQVQFLALNGYSVLQVNYRGSSGYGQQYETAGFKHWGTLIQQDILDGLHWLIKQHKTNQACIMGASFGGYSAIESVENYPNDYRCAIANAGVYDLAMLHNNGDVSELSSGRSYLKNVLGTNQQQLALMSPVNHVSKIKVPLLLAHGEHDKRAPFEQVEHLKSALEKANVSYQWFVIENEGHGFYNPDNQKRYMHKVKSFLDKHLH